jgi:hypothetical protein
MHCMDEKLAGIIHLLVDKESHSWLNEMFQAYISKHWS